MKQKIGIGAIINCISAVIAIVALILFGIGWGGSGGLFAAQYDSMGPAVAVTIIGVVLVILSIVLNILKKDNLILGFLAGCMSVVACIMFGLLFFFVLRCSVYEMGISWASDLHNGEPYVSQACSKALVAAILAVVAVIVNGIGSMFPTTKEA